ncbi:MAG: DMT family transporter [Bacteroidales bacterium]|nr:DMT family transporter [Bacteroidales bacterium]
MIKKSFLLHFGIYPIIILSMIFWGMSFVWSSIVFKYYNPITTIFLRLIISTILLFSFIYLTGKFEKLKKEDRGLFLLSSLFNPFFYFIGENFGLKHSSPTISAVIIATIPVFMPLVAYLALKERISWFNVAGIFISFFGIGIMLVNPDLSLNASPVGIMFLLLAVASAVIYSVFLKKLTLKYSSLTIITYQNALGVLYFLPLFLIFDYQHFITVKPNYELISALLQLSIFASSLAFIFFTMTVKELGVSRTNVFSNLIPVFTAIFSAIFISEIFTGTKIAGMAVVIIGVMISQVRRAWSLGLRA